MATETLRFAQGDKQACELWVGTRDRASEGTATRGPPDDGTRKGMPLLYTNALVKP